MAADAILITGASSPIGHYFCARLAQDFPDADLLALYNSNKPVGLSPRLHYLQADFLNIKSDSFTASPFTKVDTIIHLASVTPGNNTDNVIDNYYTGNVYGVMAMVKQIAAQGSLKNIFHLSSSAVYNRAKGSVLDELSEKTHQDHYGLSKLVCEHELAALHSQTGINILGLRVPVLLVEGVKYNFMSKWKSAIQQKARLKIANPDAPFNAICPGWALYESFKTQLESKTLSCIATNIFASEATTLRQILAALNYDLWDEPPAAPPGQTLTSLYKPLPFPAYSALTEVKDFILQSSEKEKAA